ncbi:MAG TPA: recombinase family protein [Thermoanaerobaculia bacterium]|jgi:DNA invertase Pin-like site-specific DNA recombinase
MKYFIYCRKSSEEDDRQIQSIESQTRELIRLFGGQGELEIVETLEEAQSAMTPGRPVFSSALDRIERGEAEGLIAWAPDRLARNAVDGGRVIHLLDTGKIKDLKFATFTFENTPSGKFMLSILFGQSKYYSDALSENVRRGIRTKIENGWLPNMAKIGYLNDSATGTIVADPERFPLVRELWELMLTGSYSPRRIREIMEERGLRTLRRKREGGRPLALSSIYNLLTNPFYAGVIPWKGRLYPGKHPALVTMDEFERVQEILGRPTKRRAKKREFAFTGMFTCGECGFAVTAEEKTNRFGSHYTYYHCSKRRLDYRCEQRSVEREEFQDQIEEFILRLQIHPKLHAYALKLVKRDQAEMTQLAEAEARALAEAASRNEIARRNLTRLRIADQITEAEFEKERQELDRERFRLEGRRNELGKPDRFEPGALAVFFSIRAAQWFREGDDQTKRTILEICGSNPLLLDQEARVSASKLFRKWENIDSIPALRGGVDDVRTLCATDKEAQKSLALIVKLLEELAPERLRAA